jgi:hypothetical protein
MTEYQKISSFADIVGHTEPGTLIAFDCDDTLLRITGDLSCKSWWSDKYAQKKHLNLHYLIGLMLLQIPHVFIQMKMD